VSKLTPAAIELALGDWTGPYGRAALNGWRRMLRTLLNDAVAQKLVADNPAARVRALRARVEDDLDHDADLDQDADSLDDSNALSPKELDHYRRSWRKLYLPVRAADFDPRSRHPPQPPSASTNARLGCSSTAPDRHSFA